MKTNGIWTAALSIGLVATGTALAGCGSADGAATGTQSSAVEATPGSVSEASSGTGVASTPLFGSYTLVSINGAPVTDSNLKPAQIVASSNLPVDFYGNGSGASPWTTTPAQPVIGQFDVQTQRSTAGFALPTQPAYELQSVFDSDQNFEGGLRIGTQVDQDNGPNPPVETGTFGANDSSFHFNVTNVVGATDGYIVGSTAYIGSTIRADVTETAENTVTVVVHSLPSSGVAASASDLVTTTYVLTRN